MANNDKSKNKGLYESFRQIYFKERTPERLYEIDELERDVDYLMAELRRLGRRVKRPDLIPASLMKLAIQITYLLHRKEYDTDQACFRAISDQFCIAPISVQLIVFNKLDVSDSWWLNEVEGGKEIDFFIPEDCIAKIPDEPFGRHGRLQRYRKHDLINMLKYLAKRIQKLEHIHFSTFITETVEKEYKREMEEVNINDVLKENDNG